MKKTLLLFSVSLMTLAGCNDSLTVNLPHNHWKYAAVQETVMRCELISYGDAKSNGTFCYEFRLCSGDYDSFTNSGDGDFVYFKLDSSTEELADGVYNLKINDPKGSLTETGYTDRATAETVLFKAGSVEIKKSGNDEYNITFSLKDDGGSVASGYYDGAFVFSDQRPEPGVAVEGLTIKVAVGDEAELLALEKVALLLINGPAGNIIDPEIILATGKCANGTFNITLPGSVESSLLIDSHDIWPSELTFSPSARGSVKQSANALLYGYYSDRRMGKFSRYDPDGLYFDQSFVYVYFDGNITIKGTLFDADSGIENIYDLNCVKGWNIVHYYYDIGPNGLFMRVTTDISRTAWEYVSESY